MHTKNPQNRHRNGNGGRAQFDARLRNGRLRARPRAKFPSTQSSSSAQQSSAEESATIKAALFGGSYLSVPVIMAKELGYYEDAGLDIDWQTVNADGTAMIATGDLDIYSTGYASVLNGVAQGEENVYLIGGVMSEGCDYVAQKL